MSNTQKSRGIASGVLLILIVLAGVLFMAYFSKNKDKIIDYAMERKEGEEKEIGEAFKKHVESRENQEETFETGDSKTTYNYSGNYPDDFPNNISIFPGSEVEMYIVRLDLDEDARIPRYTGIIFKTGSSNQSIVDFYETKLEENGWKIFKNEYIEYQDEWEIAAAIGVENTHDSHKIVVSIRDFNEQNDVNTFQIGYFDHIYPK